MRLIELVTGPWAMLPEQLIELQGIYAAHLRGDKIDIKAVEQRLGRPLANTQRNYDVVNGVAVLPLQGVLAPKANLFTQVSGGTSAQMLARDLRQAAADPSVRAIVLDVDSPGGSVYGVPELAAAVREVAAVKPTVAHTDAVMASAAYWVGSAANAVYAAGPTVSVGSIGIYARLSWSPADPNAMEITRGRYKRLALNGERPDADAIAYAEAQLDELYRVFVDAVAANRGASADDVLTRMADGRTFVGRQAAEAGLVDGFATLGELVAQLGADPRAFAARRRARFGARALADIASIKPAGAQALAAGAGDAPPPAADDAPVPRAEADATLPNPEGDPVMPQADNTPPTALTRETLERDHPALLAELRDEFVAAGAQSERDRIQAVRAQALPGHEALVEQLAFDGRTTGAEAAAAVLAAERAARAGAAAAHHADAPPAMPASRPADDAPKTKAQQVDEAKRHMAQHGGDFVGAMKALGFAT
ncbi:MAG TPA: S49 family peptidase [Rubrivivax sp.]|nr:S49 family peptidase [Rubrivivax sp.]